MDSPNDNKVAITPDHGYVFCRAKNVDKVIFERKPGESILDSYRSPDDSSDKLYRDRQLKNNGKASL